MHMSDNPEFTIRALTTDDLDQYNALLRYAFQVTEQELMMTGWKDDDFVRSKFPILERADVLGCYDEDQLVSQFAVYPLQMNIHSEICSVGYVTSVTTYPEYSGRGLMRRLMYRSLVRMREKGQVLALLFPFSMPLYRKFGWEIISNKISYVVKDNQFVPQRKHEAPGYVRRVNWDNPGFIDLHLRFAMRTHGCILRSTAAWDEYWRWEVEDTNVAVYYSTDDRPLGYMVYIIKDDVMHIKEMIYLNREAKKGLWEYISAHYSMIDEVRGFTYHNELLAFDLEDGKITETIRPYVMGRIVDVAEFFDGYRCDPTEADVCFRFEISDPFLEWNNGTFDVLFHAGRAKVVTDVEPKYTVRMSINSLSTLLLGYMPASQLNWLEKLDGSPEAVQILDEVILHEIPYISDYI